MILPGAVEFAYYSENLQLYKNGEILSKETSSKQIMDFGNTHKFSAKFINQILALFLSMPNPPAFDDRRKTTSPESLWLWIILIRSVKSGGTKSPSRLFFDIFRRIDERNFETGG